MKIEEYIRVFGADYEAMRKQPAFQKFVEVLREYSPERATQNLSAQAATENAPFFLGTIAGYNSCLDIIANKLRLDSIQIPPEETWASHPLEANND